MKNILRRIVFVLALVLCLMAMFPSGGAAGDNSTVMLVEVTGEVNPAMTAYIRDALEEAEQSGYGVLLVLDTYGGQILEADSLKQLILGTSAPVDCYITRNALSAGTLIAVSCEHIVMAPSAVIGAAETIPNDEKTLSTWVGILQSAAEARGRDTQVVAAMADKDISIDGVTEEGALLTLGADNAQAFGISDGTAETEADALSLLGYNGESTVRKQMSFSLQAAQFLTSTTVASLLFLGAIICMGIEIFTAGFGLFGILSIIFFGLYFGGGFLAGFAEWWSLLLFAVGLVLIGVEIIVPGFGVFGILGLISIGAGLVFASKDITAFLTVLAVGLVGAIIMLPILYKVIGRLGLLRRLAIGDNMRAEEGYVSHPPIENMTSKKGVALTVLRPAGTARIEGARYSVVSSGAYIEAGRDIVVVQHTPGRIVVEEMDS